MPYCEMLSSHFLHMDLASSVCNSKSWALNSISEYNNEFDSITMKLNSKDENLFQVSLLV